MLQFWVDSHTGKTEVKVDDSGQGYLGWGFPCQSVPLPECARVCMQCVLECGGTLSVHAVCAGVWIASRQRDSDLPGIDRQPEPPSLRKKGSSVSRESRKAFTVERGRGSCCSAPKSRCSGSRSLPPAFPPPLHPTAVALRLLCDAARWVQHSAPASSNKQ